MRNALVLSALIAGLLPLAAAEPIKASLVLRADRPAKVIDEAIYGHFAEHLGRMIYEGIWVGRLRRYRTPSASETTSSQR